MVLHYLDFIKFQLEHKVLDVECRFTTVTATENYFLDEVNYITILQLFNGISGVFQNLFAFFNGTIVSTFFMPPFSVCPVFLFKFERNITIIMIIKKINNIFSVT